MAAGGTAGGNFRARAGTLTLTYLNSGLERSTLRAILAQAATGIELVGPEDLVEPKDEAERIDDVFADRFLVEPVDPDEDPDDPETLMQPTPAGREVPLVSAALKRWLDSCPTGPVELGQGSGDPLFARAVHKSSQLPN